MAVNIAVFQTNRRRPKRAMAVNIAVFQTDRRRPKRAMAVKLVGLNKPPSP